MKNKIVLAYSGGLDTSFCTVWLSREKNYEVHTVVVNTGGFGEEELGRIAERAKLYGSVQHRVVDVQEEYYRNCIRYLIFGNVLRNRNYPVSVSSERTFQAMAVLDYARKEGIGTIAHGSTGAGNDQVRFELVFQVLAPEMKVMAPIRELSLSRQAEIDYLKSHGFEYTGEKPKYSINKGLWGTSVGGSETLTSHLELPEEAYPGQLEQKGSEQISLVFEKGEPKSLNGEAFGSIPGLISRLDSMAMKWGIGQDIHTGETIIGIKGRVGFQAAAARILIDAHYALEKHVLSKWQQYWKEQLGNWYGMFVHEGQFLEPVMRDIEAYLETSQRYVSGTVSVKFRPYAFQITGIESRKDLMNPKFASYGEENRSWTGEEVKGFTRILSNPGKIFFTINPEEKNTLVP